MSSFAWVRIGRAGVLGVCLLGHGRVFGGGFQAAPQGQKAVAGEQSGAGPVMSEKQRKLIEDTEKLVKMAAELKVSVDKSSKNELSLDVVRKAEAVEKLAKSVKEQIREAR